VTALVTVFWLAVTFCSLLGLVALVAVGSSGTFRRLGDVASGRAEPATWVWVMTIVTGIGYGLSIILLATQTAEFFDRYMLPAAPLVLIILALGYSQAIDPPVPAWRGWATAGRLFLVGGLSVAATHDYLAWSRARWEAVRYLTADLGVSPDEIDGGYEFNGSTTYRWRMPPATDGRSWWWVQRATYVLTSGPMAGYRGLKRSPVSGKILPVGPTDVLILERASG
jgi:hypothetical protein